MKKDAAETTQWSSKLAYAVGLLVADGSLSNDGRHIDFTSKDYMLVNALRRCLGKEHCKIGTKHSGTSDKVYYRIQFSDKQLYIWLTKIGVMPRKSTSITKVEVPSKFFFVFLRGVFDGDGTIYETRDLRWKEATTVAMGFASGSEEFLQWLRYEINQLLDTTGFITKGARVLQLRYGKQDARSIFNELYKDSSTPRLERKFAKMQKILRIVEPS